MEVETSKHGAGPLLDQHWSGSRQVSKQASLVILVFQHGIPIHIKIIDPGQTFYGSYFNNQLKRTGKYRLYTTTGCSGHPNIDPKVQQKTTHGLSWASLTH